MAFLLAGLSISLGCRAEVRAAAEEKEEAAVKEAPVQCPVCPPCQVAEVKPQAAGEAEPDSPKECVLYHLVNLYDLAVFNHAAHTEYEADCEVCHHHSSEVEKFPPCRECHGFPSDTITRPGLKGAYHRQCMNCHRQMESGPLGCEDCHKSREPVSVSQKELAQKFVHDTMKLGHISQDFAEVVFNHKLHVELSDNCESCHHHQKDYEVTPPCRECHNHAETEPGSKLLGLKDAYHEQCLNCHKSSTGKGKKSPLQCTDCHHSKNAPRTVSLSSLAKTYKPIEFDHSMHADDAVEFCTDCHHASKDYDRIVKCETCHKPGQADGKKVDLLNAYHLQCINCHKKNESGPQECADCHSTAE